MAKKILKITHMPLTKSDKLQLSADVALINSHLPALQPLSASTSGTKGDGLRIEFFDESGVRIMKDTTPVSNAFITSGKVPLIITDVDKLRPGKIDVKLIVVRPANIEVSIPQADLDFRIDNEGGLPQLVKVNLDSPAIRDTADESLWKKIIKTDVSYSKIEEIVDKILAGVFTPVNKSTTTPETDLLFDLKTRLPFVNVEEYSLVLFIIDLYMKKALRIDKAANYMTSSKTLPYYTHLSDPLDEIIDDYIPRVDKLKPKDEQEDGYKVIFNERTKSFPAIELIWSYWMEQGMLVQSMNAISLRFQNVKGIQNIEPLARFDTNPLRPLSNMIWGFIQDEQHRTTIHRRLYEYQHAYNLTLIGRAVPVTRPVDNRSNFLEAFHNLLHYATIFYKDYDDMTRRADGFPLLTALREVHLLLAEGNHNAYYNMTYTTRAEMMAMQYLLARQEMQTFLGGRPMVPYPERWMDRVDTMKNLQGWDNTSILHYYDLAYNGEKILLGIRYGDWANSGFKGDDASNWAVAFRDHIMKYVNAYRVVTGIDLSVDAIRVRPEDRALQPSHLIQRRLQAAAEPMELPQQQPQMRIRMPAGRRY